MFDNMSHNKSHDVDNDAYFGVFVIVGICVFDGQRCNVSGGVKHPVFDDVKQAVFPFVGFIGSFDGVKQDVFPFAGLIGVNYKHLVFSSIFCCLSPAIIDVDDGSLFIGVVDDVNICFLPPSF